MQAPDKERGRLWVRRRLVTPFTIRWLTVIVLIAIWQLVATVGLSHNAFLAAPSTIAISGFSPLGNSDTVNGWLVTTERFLIAFVLTTVIGVMVGMALGRSGHYMPVAQDLMYVLYTLPLVPFYPLFVLFLGVGARPEIAFGIAHGVVPVILLTMSAASRVDTAMLTAAGAMGAGRMTRLRLVVLPAILPDVVGALRVGASLCLLGVLLAELMISVDGIGHIITQLAANLEAAPLDAAILVVCVGAVFINTIMGAAEKRLGRWRSAASVH